VAEDVWGSELAVEVQAAKSKVRKSVEARLHAPVRASVSILAPDNGISINPLDELHQDALGMAVAAQYDRLDNAEWAKAAITPKPSVLLEPDIHVADDQSDENGDGGEEVGGDMLVFAGAPERKSRSERNRAARRRQAEAQQVRRRARVNQAKQIDNIEELCAMADVEVRKLEGGEAAARRRRAQKLASLNRDPTRAAPRVRKLAGVRVPTENAVSSVPLSSDLAKNLRAVVMPKTNPLMRDRFLSLQRRGFIEPPPAIAKERAQARKDRVREEQRDKLIRKGRGSRSNLTYWRKPRKR
jgi:Nop53 (60S ribosomal biogenesis)